MEAEKNSISFPTYDQINEEMIEPGNDTFDMIFIPSWGDIVANSRFCSKKADSDYGSVSPSSVSLGCVPTEYAIARGVYTNDTYVKGHEAEWGVEPKSKTCNWWIRNPGKSNSTAEAIRYAGDLDYYGLPVNTDSIAVRPAMWVTIFDGNQK